jgi:hypothetical protein
MVSCRPWSRKPANDGSPEGLTRGQFSELFHRYVRKERIDLALQQPSTLGYINRFSKQSRGLRFQFRRTADLLYLDRGRLFC